MKKITTLLLTAAILFSFKSAEQSSWALDKAHAKLGFTISHLMVSDIEGSFKSFDAKITASKEDFSDAVVEMTGDVNSINTDNEQRDAHLKGADFFDAAKFPSITFKSKSFKKTDDKTYKVIGDFTMHGVTKTVELTAVCRTGTNPMSKKTIAGFKVSGTILRKDFGIGASMPATMLGEEVTLNANAEFAKN